MHWRGPTARLGRTDDGLVVDGVEVSRDGGFDAVLNRVIRALPASGGSIWIDAGVYSVSESIVVDRPLWVQGAGPGNTTDGQNMTILLGTDDLRGPVVTVTGENSPQGFMHGTRLAGLGLVAGQRGSETDCLRFAPGDGVDLTKISVERLLVDGARRHGVRFTLPEDDGDIKHVNVQNVWSGHHGGDAISLDGGRRYWLTNCYGYDSTNGIYVAEDAADVSVIAPHCRQNEAAGLLVRGGPTQVQGGRFIDNDVTGITVDGADHVTVGQVELFNNTEVGVSVGDTRVTRGTTLVGNRVGNVNDGSQVTVSLRDLPSRLRELGPDDAVQKLRQYGVSNVVSGYLTTSGIDKSQQCGVVVDEGAVGTTVSETTFVGQDGVKIRDEGVRTRINGLCHDDGPPDDGGQWHGEGTHGDWLVDTESDDLYLRVRDGWHGPV